MTRSVSGLALSDDMHDTAADLATLAKWPPLHNALVLLDEILVPTFDAADMRALRSQRRYRWVILLTASGGSAAVLFALAQLTLERLGLSEAALWAARGEVASLGATVLAVVLGSLVVWLEHWLIDRFRAEQLRLLKFRALLDPRIWGADKQRAAWRADVETQHDRLAVLDRVELKHQSEREAVPRLVTRDECREITPDSLDALVRYYLRKRVITQRDYFAAAASRGIAFFDRPKLLPAFFGFSVLIVAAHVAVDWWPAGASVYAEKREIASTLLIAASAALPVTWAGIRTWRSAREFSRNVARSAARREMLNEMAERLEGKREVEPSNLLGELQICELVLDSDQREWLRLMREVEWYG
ncbi:MAG: hypothetical protein ABJC63_10975 [Gemmatimonadales bacterium]